MMWHMGSRRSDDSWFRVSLTLEHEGVVLFHMLKGCSKALVHGSKYKRSVFHDLLHSWSTQNENESISAWFSHGCHVWLYLYV
jgi:hypothetical protein